MRLFDIVGGLSVLAWCSIVGYFVYDHYVVPESHALEAGAVFREGQSYMILTREDEEVGYIHEARTEVVETDSWLLEYDLMMNVSMLGIDQYLQTRIKATVSRSAVLREFSAAIETAGTTFDLSGEVEGNVVTMKMDLAGEPRTQKITLQDPPRLSNSALNELVASPDLEPGMTFEQEYFDPTTMGMTTMTFEFIRRRTITVYDEEVETFHFRQKVSGTELDAYVDRFGEVQLQEFPLRIVGARVPEVLGQARALSMKQRFEAEQGSKVATAPNLSLEATMGLIKSGDLGSALSTSRYRITGIPEGIGLQLDSGQQLATAKRENVAEVDTAQRREDAIDHEVDLEPMKESTLRVDADHESFEDLLPENAPQTPTLKAEMIARNVRKRLQAAPQIGIQTASAALETGAGDCTEYALVLVAALRHHDVPARFVSGVKLDENGQFILHQWVQYWDAGRFIDIDPTTTAMLPGTDQIQLFTHNSPDKPELVTVIEQIQIEKILDEPTDAASPEGVDTDFN